MIYRGFRTSASDALPVPGLSFGILKECGDGYIVIGVIAEEDGVKIHIGLNMIGPETQNFAEVRHNLSLPGYLFTKNPLKINISQVEKDGLTESLSPLDAALEEADQMFRNNSKNGNYIMNSYFPMQKAESLRAKNKRFRIMKELGGIWLGAMVSCGLAGAAVGIENLNTILQHIPDDLLIEFVRMAKEHLHQELQNSESPYSGNSLFTRRYAGFIAFAQSIPIATIMAPVITAVHEITRKKPKYVDDL